MFRKTHGSPSSSSATRHQQDTQKWDVTVQNVSSSYWKTYWVFLISKVFFNIHHLQVTIDSSMDTLYWCKIIKAPSLNEKHHIIGYEALLTRARFVFLFKMSHNDRSYPSVWRVLQTNNFVEQQKDSMSFLLTVYHRIVLGARHYCCTPFSVI